jgi:hypothetical protein
LGSIVEAAYFKVEKLGSTVAAAYSKVGQGGIY